MMSTMSHSMYFVQISVAPIYQEDAPKNATETLKN